MTERVNQLVALDEDRRKAHQINLKRQQDVKYQFDRRTRKRKFQVNDLVLIWNAKGQEKGKHGKFQPLWMGPYQVCNTHGEDSYFLQALDGEVLELPVHGQFLKFYFA